MSQCGINYSHMYLCLINEEINAYIKHLDVAVAKKKCVCVGVGMFLINEKFGKRCHVMTFVDCLNQRGP